MSYSKTSEDFDDVVAEVQSGTAVTEREVIEYPIPKKGVYQAHCIKAEEVDARYQGAQPGEKSLLVTFELDATYEGNDGKTRHFWVRTKPIGLRYTPKAYLYQFFKDLTGDPIISRREFFKRNGKEMYRDFFDYKGFVGMKCELVIIHYTDDKKGKTYANIASISCNDEQKQENMKIFNEGGRSVEYDEDHSKDGNARAKKKR